MGEQGNAGYDIPKVKIIIAHVRKAFRRILQGSRHLMATMLIRLLVVSSVLKQSESDS